MVERHRLPEPPTVALSMKISAVISSDDSDWRAAKPVRSSLAAASTADRCILERRGSTEQLSAAQSADTRSADSALGDRL